MTHYKWILLQNLNDGLSLIWLALLVGTVIAGVHFFTDVGNKDSDITFARFKLKWLRWLCGTLLLLGTVLVALPDKEQIALMRGEPVVTPSEAKPYYAGGVADDDTSRPRLTDVEKPECFGRSYRLCNRTSQQGHLSYEIETGLFTQP